MHRLLLLTVLLIPCPTDLEALRRKLRHEDSDVRAKAVRTLGRMNRLEATRLMPDLLLDPNPYVRDSCFTALSKIDDARSIGFLIAEGMKRPEAKVRLDVAEWAGDRRIQAAVPSLVRLLEDPSPRVRQAAALSLAEIGDRSAVGALEDRLRERTPSIRAQVLLALGRVGGEEAGEAVREALSDRSWEMRVAALTVADGSLPPEEALAAGARGMEDRAWPVRAAAIDVLSGLKAAGAVVPLIEGLRAEGRLRHDAHRALGRLTGKDLPLDPDLWLQWWEVNKGTFDPAASGPPADDPRRTRTRLRYHGLPVVSLRIAFVLDLSGSMREPLGARSRASKLELARGELCRVIDHLPGKAMFNIYFYNDEVRPWRREAVHATRERQREARGFVDGQRARGYTNLYGALRAALEDLQVDTIYLLSDGGPSRGEVIFKDRILRRVEARNRIRRVVIHTIDTGSRKWHQRGLLEGLAGASGGRCHRLEEE